MCVFLREDSELLAFLRLTALHFDKKTDLRRAQGDKTGEKVKTKIEVAFDQSLEGNESGRLGLQR